MIMCTCFLKIAMVLIMTRNALGIQQVPPNIAMYSIALAATFFIMAPVFNDFSERLQERPLDLSRVEMLSETILFIIEPFRLFMKKSTDPDILQHLEDNALLMWPKEMADSVSSEHILIIIPAFVLSELENAFKIGFLIFIPFLVVDLIVSNFLMALGMQMVSPMTVSLPLKILLFVMVNGWTRLLDGLFYSYL